LLKKVKMLLYLIREWFLNGKISLHAVFVTMSTVNKLFYSENQNQVSLLTLVQ